MTEKPRTADGYPGDQVERVRATCLYVATKLGDLMEDLVVVGGLVPSLLVDQTKLPKGVDAHVGTLDLNLGLTVALLDQGRYEALTERLRAAGFQPDENEAGNLTRQRWRIGSDERVTVDFLISPSLPGDRAGRLRDIERDFAAVIARGVHLAFRDREIVPLSGMTLFGETATREIRVAGPGAHVVLKALAFDGRGENKDAYDLYYLVRNFAGGVGAVAARLLPLLVDDSARDAIGVLRRDFTEHDAVGPRRVAEFLTGTTDDEIQADVVGYVLSMLAEIDKKRPE